MNRLAKGQLVLKRLSAFAILFLVVNEVRAGDETICNRAKNLARMNCGTRIESVTPDGRSAPIAVASERNRSAAALLLDDDTLSFPLREGETNLIVTLCRTAFLERFAFVNENAAARGDVKIEVSNYRLATNDRRWIPVDGNISFTATRFVERRMVGVEAKYVKLSFHVEKEGRLAALALYGDQTLQTFAIRQNHVTQAGQTIAYLNAPTRPEDFLNFNFANSYAQSHIVYASSGKLAQAGRMIDDDVLSAFEFSARDPHPTVVAELAKIQRLHRVSAVYKMGVCRVDVYLLNELPKSIGDWRDLKPIASIFDRDGSGEAAVDFGPQSARYVALRWTLESSKAAAPFEVAEIGAFGYVPLSLLDLNQLPELFAGNSTETHLPGESGSDFSNKLGTVADPPMVGVVSP